MDDHKSLSIKKTMGVKREEYLDYMTFRTNKPPLFTETFGPLIGLKEEWEKQGATPKELDFSAFKYCNPLFVNIPVNTGWIGNQKEKILEETDEHIIALDYMGRRVKLCKGYATIPLPMDYPVKTMDDWVKIKNHYEFSESRFGNDWNDVAEEYKKIGYVVQVNIPGGFWEPRQLMGDECLCIAYYSQPELVRDILDTIGNTVLKVLNVICSAVQVDQISLPEDMAGKNGPLIGPKQVEEFIKPYYRKIWDFASSHGVKLFLMDSDGNMNPIIPILIESGINVISPVESSAGMDIVKIREKYGTKLAMIGGIDKYALRRTQKEISAELEYKIPPMVRTGGCMLGLDHRILNGTPLENYRFYIEKVWEILNTTDFSK